MFTLDVLGGGDVGVGGRGVRISILVQLEFAYFWRGKGGLSFHLVPTPLDARGEEDVASPHLRITASPHRCINCTKLSNESSCLTSFVCTVQTTDPVCLLSLFPLLH